MRNKFSAELILGCTLIALLLLLVNPWKWWMPTPLEMMIVALIVALFSIFLIFVWRERPRDEREQRQQGLSAHMGFMIGALILILGLIQQSLSHRLDMWLVSALAGMILGKIISWISNR